MEHSREVYGIGSDLGSFQAELEAASQRLAQAEADLTQARASTGLYATGSDSLEATGPPSALQAQVALLNQRLAEYRADLDSLRYLASLLEEASPGTDLEALPWELLAGPVLSQRGRLTLETAGSLLESPEALLAAIREEEAALSQTAEQLSAQSESLQGQLADRWLAFGLAGREYSLARETHDLLRRKVDEAAIQGRVDPGQLLLVSEAVPPPSPVQTRQLAQVAVAGVIGLIVGVLLALWLELRSQSRHASRQQVQEDLEQAPAAE
jgi:hypothetical protein